MKVSYGACGCSMNRKMMDYIRMVNLSPPIRGFENFIASYIVEGEGICVVEAGPASSVQNLLDSLRKNHISFDRVNYVAVSHVHIDHAGGAGLLLRQLPNARLVVHSEGSYHMVNPSKLWESTKRALGDLAAKFGEMEPVPQERILEGREGLSLELGNSVDIRVMETPGHAPHHLSFYIEKDGVLFAGEAGGTYLESVDAIRPSTPPPSFDLAKFVSSIDRLISLNPKLTLYSHFGRSYNGVKKLKTVRRQLILWSEIVSEERHSSVEAIYSRILKKDPNMKTLTNWEWERYFMMNNIRGILQYIEKTEEAGSHGRPF